MRRLTVVGMLLAAVLTFGARPAAAQDREGFWFGFGGGWGSATVSTDQTGDGDSESSGVGYIKVGGTLNRHVLIGGELNAWRKTTALNDLLDARLTMYNLAATLSLYPGERSGFFVKGGAGLAIVNGDVNAPSAKLKLDMGSGLGLIFGAGYDIPLGDSVSLTPAVNYWRGSIGDVDIAGTPTFNGWTQNVFDLTLGLTFR